ncbi:hypothetical protein D3C73_736720 [compost metagenome]
MRFCQRFADTAGFRTAAQRQPGPLLLSQRREIRGGQRQHQARIALQHNPLPLNLNLDLYLKQIHLR